MQPRRRTTRGYGQEVTFCCFNAVLRDYARLGRLLAHDGSWEGRRLIPPQWLVDATTVRPADAYLAPGTATRFYGYGYQVWILPGAQRRFALIGIRGQDPGRPCLEGGYGAHRRPPEAGGSRRSSRNHGAVVGRGRADRQGPSMRG